MANIVARVFKSAAANCQQWQCRKHRFTCFAAAITLSLLFLQSVQARPFDDVIDSGYLTVFVYKDYAPYSWKQDGEFVGMDVDIAREFGKQLNVEIRFLMRGADENVDDDLRVNIWKGDLIHRKAADVMMHVPYDRELDIRNEFIVLTSPYFLEQMAVVHDTNIIPELNTFARFVYKPIGVEVDTAGDFFLSNAFRGQLHRNIRRGRTFDEVITMYSNGEVPAVMGSRAQTEWVALQAKNINSKIVQPPMPGIVRTSWPIGLAVKHDSRDLGYALYDVIAELRASGKLSDIAAKFGVKWLEPELD